MKLSTLLKPWQIKPCVDADITHLTSDSRQVVPGSAFIAYPGIESDGRNYIDNAIKLGARAILYEPPLDKAQTSPDIVFIPIEQLKFKCSEIAAVFFHHPANKLRLTGITGTNGKTTVAFMMAQACNLLHKECAYIGTLGQGRPHELTLLNNTTPDAIILQSLFNTYVNEKIKDCVMEVSSHALAQGRVKEIPFQHAIFTNLSHDHLDYHGTMDAYAQAKACLFKYKSLKSALINIDDAYGTYMRHHAKHVPHVLTFGQQQNADYRISNHQLSIHGSEFTLNTPKETLTIKTPHLGLFNLYNLTAIFASLELLGFHSQWIVPILSKLQACPGRMQVMNIKPCIIVDFAHTPDALEKVLLTIKALHHKKLILVFGCGGGRDASKREKMGELANKYADYAIITNDNPRKEAPSMIANDILKGMDKTFDVLTLLDRKDAIAHAIKIADGDDVVVVAGKGHEQYQEIGSEKMYFSDQAVINQCLFNKSHV